MRVKMYKLFESVEPHDALASLKYFRYHTCRLERRPNAKMDIIAALLLIIILV